MNNSKQTTDTIIQFIQTTFNDAHKTTAVIGLSGGIDSATSLFLTAKAIGPKHIHALYLPTKKSNPIHQEDALSAAKAAGLPDTNFHILPIGSIIQKSWRIISKNRAESEVFSAQSLESDAGVQEFAHGAGPHEVGASTHNSDSESHDNSKLRLANLTARIRMLILFDQAKKRDALVIGTENRSEQMLGYFTRFGDEASDLEPIVHLFKTQVIELAKHLGVPESIIAKSPTADLWPGQTDATELGFTYEEADPILALIQKGETPTSELADKIIASVKKAAFKQLVPYHL